MTSRISFRRAAFVAALVAAGSFDTAEAHITYGGRDFGTWSDPGSGWTATGNSGMLLGDTVTITGQTASSLFGWADATDNTWGDSHRMRAFRFTLNDPGKVTVSVTRADTEFLPGFSIYEGLSFTSPQYAHDGALKSIEWLTDTFGTTGVAETFTDTNSNSQWDPGESFTDDNGNGVWDSAGLGSSGKEGSFNSLGDWTIGNSDALNEVLEVVVPASLRSFTYVGHAADGTSTNYGTFGTATILGDGLADGFVTGTFDLAAGDYSIFVGGADYAAQLTQGSPFPTYEFTASLTVAPVPEPSSMALAAIGVVGAAALIRRRRR
jgi:hypothetical protein